MENSVPERGVLPSTKPTFLDTQLVVAESWSAARPHYGAKAAALRFYQTQAEGKKPSGASRPYCSNNSWSENRSRLLGTSRNGDAQG